MDGKNVAWRWGSEEECCKWHSHYRRELKVIITCIRPVKDQVSQNSTVDGEGLTGSKLGEKAVTFL